MAKKISGKKTQKLIAQACAGKHDKQIALASEWIPNIFVIGAPKSATTSLTAVFQRHPEFRVSYNFEPNFFGANYARGWDWYKKKMGEGFGDGVFRCEASTMYSNASKRYLRTPELIKRSSPDAKIIYLVRNPLDRMVSQWRHLRGRNHMKDVKKYVAPSFSEVLSDSRLRKKIVGTSLYYTTLLRYKSFFGDSQIHCMTFEDFIGSPRKSLRAVFDFLGADPLLDLVLDSGNRLPMVNQAGTKGRQLVEKPEWPKGLKRALKQEVKPEARAFLNAIGKPAGFWDY